MRKMVTFAAVLALGTSGVACGGGGDSDLLGRSSRFCDLLEQTASLDDLDIEDEASAREAGDVLDELRDAAPSSLSDDIDLVIEAFDALAAGDFDRLMDESFQRDLDEAGDNLDRYAEDECGIDVDGRTDEPDPTGPDSTGPDPTDGGANPGAPTPPQPSIDDGVPVVVTAQGVAFWPSYGEQQGTWAAIVTNPNTDLIAEYISVQATFKDATGAVVGTDTSYLAEIAPGETRAVATDYLDVADTAVTVEVITSTESYRSADAATIPLAFGTPTLVRDEDGRLTIVAEVTNNGDELAENPTVTAVFRTPDGTVVGGTQSYMSFVPPGGTVGVEASTSLALPTDATIELYADWSSISYRDEVDAEQVTISDQGFGILASSGTPVGAWAALVTNPNGDLAASYVATIATFRDAAGSVVAVETASINGIAAGGAGAVGSDYLYDLPPTAVTMDVAAWAMNWNDDPADGAITVSGLTLTPQEFGGVQITGEIASTFAVDGDGIGMVAVFRDGSGTIVGGTSGYLDILPAGGSTGFTIDSSADFPDTVTAEVYADVGSLLDP